LLNIDGQTGDSWFARFSFLNPALSHANHDAGIFVDERLFDRLQFLPPSSTIVRAPLKPLSIGIHLATVSSTIDPLHADVPGSLIPWGGREWALLALVVVAFLAIRLPVMYLDPGGEDEDTYAVPGLTILKTGIPQLPHVPARNLDSVFYFADKVMFTEPPLTFYFQALFFMVLPHEYGTARLFSGVCGILILGLMASLFRQALRDPAAILIAVAMFSLSRWFFFAACRARPDILCALWGLAAIWATFRWRETARIQWLPISGLLIGLGGLSHPFAIVYAVQIAVWVALESRGWRRLANPLLVAACSLLVVSLWLPLILSHFEIFKVQLANQLFRGHDQSLFERLLFPWTSLRYHGLLMWDYNGVWQNLLVSAPLLAATVVSWKTGNSALRILCGLAWTSIYLMAACTGSHHPVVGYWVYPAGLTFVGVGWAIQSLNETLPPRGQPGHWKRFAVAAALLLSMAPGSGIRTTLAHLQHWNDINYNAPRFVKKIIASLPADARFTVDTQFGLDFVVSGRKTTLGQTLPLYFRAEQFPYDYLIVSRYGKTIDIADDLCGELIRTEGNFEDIFACYAEIYRPSPQPCPEMSDTD
jgi:4-amino-4-deoxy-L-arabinose transferase-like glycosyltransferase